MSVATALARGRRAKAGRMVEACTIAHPETEGHQ